jgi:hypothetical protein
MGDATNLKSVAQKITDSVTDSVTVEVVELDMENENESVFHHAVDKACKILGKFDAFVNCYSYEGKINTLILFCKIQYQVQLQCLGVLLFLL